MVRVTNIEKAIGSKLWVNSERKLPSSVSDTALDRSPLQPPWQLFVPATGPLPARLLASIDRMERDARYKVDKLREYSRILEPHVQTSSYRHFTVSAHPELDQELVRIANVTEGDLDRELKTAVSFAEPLMLFFIAAFIGSIFISMVLPIFTMQEYIK